MKRYIREKEFDIIEHEFTLPPHNTRQYFYI